MHFIQCAEPVSASDFRAVLADALEEANLPTLLLVLHQLTGDRKWVEEPYRPTPRRGLDDHDSGGLGPEVQAEVREAAFEAIVAVRQGALTPQPAPEPARLAELMGISLAEEVPSEYGSLLAEEMGVASREVPIVHQNDVGVPHVVVVGCGIAGLNIAIMLKKAGIPFTVIDKNEEIGGTWLENHYPGCGVDTPSHLYSFSFAPKADWGSYFGKQEEVFGYLRSLAGRYGLYENIRFGCEVRTARWVDDAHWVLDVRGAAGQTETISADVLVSGLGHFNQPSIPHIEGVESFPGPVLHTARWDRSVDVTGKRVAVVGTGASAMQVVPDIAGTASHVTVFQRSRQWAIPHPNCGRPVSARVQWLLEHVPFYAGLYRLRQFWGFGDRLHPALQLDPDYEDPEFAVNATNASHRRFLTRYIESHFTEKPELARLSVPDYPAYGKRPLIDHGWYRTIARDDVTLLEGGLGRVDGTELMNADGTRVECDVVVLATGFQTLNMLGSVEIVGRSGRSLQEAWGADDATAYLGITVPDFPNFYILFGPNTSAGHGGSAFLSVEMQVRYVMELLKLQIEQGLASLEVRREVHDAYMAELDDALSRTVWNHPRVTNYYKNRRGRIVGTYPHTYLDYWRRTRQPDLAEYIVQTTTGQTRAAEPVGAHLHAGDAATSKASVQRTVRLR